MTNQHKGLMLPKFVSGYQALPINKFRKINLENHNKLSYGVLVLCSCGLDWIATKDILFSGNTVHLCFRNIHLGAKGAYCIRHVNLYFLVSA